MIFFSDILLIIALDTWLEFYGYASSSFQKIFGVGFPPTPPDAIKLSRIAAAINH